MVILENITNFALAKPKQLLESHDWQSKKAKKTTVREAMLGKQDNDGAIAQLVEQRTENPCVPGSIPGGTTSKIANNLIRRLLAIFHSTQFGQVPYKVTYHNAI